MNDPLLPPPLKAKRRFVMSITEKDEDDLRSIVVYYRKKAGFELTIADIQRKLWKDEVQRIKNEG